MSMRQVWSKAAAACVLGVVLMAADSPFVGTWKFSPDKSKITPGSPALKAATVMIEAEGNTLKATVEGTDPEGKPIKYVAKSALDGTPGTITGSPTMDATETKQVNDHTIDAVAKKDGKLVYTDHRVVSKDGKTMTVTRTGMTADGKKYKNTLILDKQ
jgi:hypothetical protein